MKGHGLSLWAGDPPKGRAGDLAGLPALCLLDLEIGQVEFLGAGDAATNGSLDLFDLVILQGLVCSGTAIAAIRVKDI